MRVYVVIYKEVPRTMSYASWHTKTVLQGLHEHILGKNNSGCSNFYEYLTNINFYVYVVQRYPDHDAFNHLIWAVIILIMNHLFVRS